jgi:hypothetical protein
VNAMVTLSKNALAVAKSAEPPFLPTRSSTPLHGVPFTVKDSIDTASENACYRSIDGVTEAKNPVCLQHFSGQSSLRSEQELLKSPKKWVFLTLCG